jgi:hypothetical protein
MIDDIKEILENVKVMETAARELCKLRGIDADHQDDPYHPRAWQNAANEITTMLQVLGAVGIAVEAADNEKAEGANDAL